MTTKEMLEKVLNEMKKIGCIEASVIATKDGLLINSNMPKNWNSEVVVLMYATVLEAAERVNKDFGKGTLDRVIVESKQGKIILTEAGAKTILAVMTKPEADLVLVMDELANATQKIKEMLG
jgi:predicted regulator of Ras-like GTPase activity (Roadblock/LC7/MglB family)